MSVIVGIIAGVGGIGAGYLVAKTLMKKNIENRSGKLLRDATKEAEALKKEKILQAKERFLELKSEHEKVINGRNQKVEAGEKRIKEKEAKASQRLEDTKRKEREMDVIKANLE
ncbi:MAG: ribonuclease Y, partial [Flavobacteriales bacterium]